MTRDRSPEIDPIWVPEEMSDSLALAFAHAASHIGGEHFDELEAYLVLKELLETKPIDAQSACEMGKILQFCSMHLGDIEH